MLPVIALHLIKFLKFQYPLQQMLPDANCFEPSFHWYYVESSPFDVAQCPLHCRIFAST